MSIPNASTPCCFLRDEIFKSRYANFQVKLLKKNNEGETKRLT